MPLEKRPIEPSRVRRMGRSGFGWIDRRFLREHAARLTRDEMLLYFFLVCVADGEGLSYWGDARAAALLKLDLAEFTAARRGLVVADLVAWSAPLYQVLELPPARRRAESGGESGGAATIGDILRELSARKVE